MSTKTLGPIRRSFAPWEEPEARPLIEFRNVGKSFGSFTALEDVSLGIYEREFFALLGPSGCGKTTLMRMLAGFERPTRGDVLLGGVSLGDTPPEKRPVNMMFQSYALFPHMSVEKNVAFGLQMDKVPKGEIAARVQEMLHMVKLEPFAKRKPSQLSGGQRQRVALARSLAKKPKVLLLDEPLGALDRKLREETQFELMDLQMKLGITFLIVTHDQEEAMTLADRIAVMDQGRLVQVGPPSAIYEQPSTCYVADFIGDINILEGTVAGSDRPGTVRMEGCANGSTIEVETETSVSPGSKAWFAIRPEKIHIGLAPPPPDAVNVAQGVVWDIGYLGDVSVYHVRLPNGATLRANVTNSRRLVERPIGWEDQVWLSWSRDAGILLTR
jgi:putrescine transport system ATP-binding protein